MRSVGIAFDTPHTLHGMIMDLWIWSFIRLNSEGLASLIGAIKILYITWLIGLYEECLESHEILAIDISHYDDGSFFWSPLWKYSSTILTALRLFSRSQSHIHRHKIATL